MRHSYILVIIVSFFNTIIFSQTKSDLKTITKIEKSVITDFDIVIDSNYKSNQPITFQCLLKTDNGKQINASGYVAYVFLNMVGKNAKINSAGNLELDHTNIGIESSVNITFRFKKDTSITKTLNLPVNFKGSLCLDYRGEKGKDGEHGKNNNRKDTDPLSVFAIGGNGKNGENGGNGKNIYVCIEKRNIEKLGKDFLVITVLDSALNKTDIYYSDPLESNLIINISGGNGGNGGIGGRGAKGDLPPAGNGVPRIAEDGWYGGNGGNGGMGGDCGKISLKISSSAAFYKPFIEIVSIEGKGGKSGLPGRRGEVGDLEYMGKRFAAEKYHIRNPSDLYENPGKPGIDGNCNKGNILIIDN